MVVQPPTCVTTSFKPLLHEIPGKVTVPVLQFDVEQHEYAMPLPLIIGLSGH